MEYYRNVKHNNTLYGNLMKYIKKMYNKNKIHNNNITTYNIKYPLKILDIFNVSTNTSLSANLLNYTINIYLELNNTTITCYLGEKYNECFKLLINNNTIPSVTSVEQLNCYSDIGHTCKFRLYFKIIYYFLINEFKYNGPIKLYDASCINNIPTTEIRLLRDEGSIYNACGFTTISSHINKNNNIINIVKNFYLPYMNITIEEYIKFYFKTNDLYNNDTELLLTYIDFIIIKKYDIIEIKYKYITILEQLYRDNNKNIYIQECIENIQNINIQYPVEIQITNNKNKNNISTKKNIININEVNNNINRYLNNNIFYILNYEINELENKIRPNISIPFELYNKLPYTFKYELNRYMICYDISKLNINCGLI